MDRDTSVSILRRAGIRNPLRLEKLIRGAIDFFDLDLRGLTVLTEAASGPYVVTPIIASLAGATQVFALTQNSSYATAAQVEEQTRALEFLCRVDQRIQVYTDRPSDIFGRADIITNLGFVRPLDRETIHLLKPASVIPLMCEAWEYRDGDLDLAACREKKISVAGTNEDYPGLDVFSYSGFLCMKMLFDAQMEVHKCRLAVIGSDKFARVIQEHLSCCGVDAIRMPRMDINLLHNMDAIIIADYTRKDEILGASGDVTPGQLASLNPAVNIIQFAGRIDLDGLHEQGIFVYPDVPLSSLRMAKTLADLGSRPVIELHAAGLKVGEYLIKSGKGKSAFDDLVQLFN